MSRDPVLRRAAISWAHQGELTPQRLWPVLRALGGVEALLASSEEELTKRLESGTRALAVLRSAEDVSSEKWVTQLERAGVRVVTAFDEEYPHSLAEISDPPFLLFATGNLERLLETLPPESGELTEDQLEAELDRRFDAYQRDPSVGIPWSEIKRQQ